MLHAFIEVDDLRQMVQAVRKQKKPLTKKFSDGLRSCNVPEPLHEGLLMFCLEGVPTGSFLEAVIDNDLAEACGRADENNRYRLFDIVAFLHNYAPTGSWHYEGAMSRWCSLHQQERAAAAAGERADAADEHARS